jgi:hypothetical protein
VKRYTTIDIEEGPPGPFAEWQTTEALAAAYGRDVAWAEMVLASALVPVRNGLFSLSALRAATALTGSKAADAATPQPEVSPTTIVVRAFAELGLEIFDVQSNRGLVGKLRPLSGETKRFWYSHRSLEGLLDVEPEEFDDPEMFIELSREKPKKLRVFTTAKQHAGLAHFTVAVARAEEVDFAVFVDVSSERVWIVSTEDMKSFLDGEAPLTHAHRHNNAGPIRFAFPRKAKFYTLANRIHTVP